MAYARTPSSEIPIGTNHVRLQRAASRADVFPRLIAMQKQLRARNFAVFRISGAGLPGKRRLFCEMENWGGENAHFADLILGGYADALLDHIELSTLPLAWSGTEQVSFVEAFEFTPLLRRLPSEVTPFSGVAFPVRLGAMGNGYVIFTGGSFSLSSDLMIEHHVRSCHIMTDLLALDERRTVPAETLSEREVACLQLAGDGRISEEIAENLGLSVHTVNAYLGSATMKLDAVNRIQAIAKAIRLGYIH
ncbi:DNA-binding CsgD family transcriptional regulator [Pseudorhizobium tarimense]|uniref:DNA-binding CsgD family transcriptional regulator n=1 Tax=Pseudorhizobium tarimense TaxID=1079109 RepID=A0ABV2HAK9_9HYPH|nr:helix-turn-helix transcriptional regulator [Pseudorhizobium tarimense]MCJ8520873.1 helix-turn-helix transcriptional regulator [Pseudorhizobium tarimense]